ncbi:MAG: hypothetical protein ACR2JE_06945 [Acidobacteriaceae bacterium]
MAAHGKLGEAGIPLNPLANLRHQNPVTSIGRGRSMTKGKARLLWVGMLAFSSSLVQAQSPQEIIQQVVNTERTANRNDHSQWMYLDEASKPKEHVLQWVAGTQQGDVRRVLKKNDQKLTESQQRELIQKFLRDTKAQNKQIAENNHDSQQVDDLLKLLPAAFLWTQTGATSTTTTLHFDPAPNFHPPTREARVFSSMTGDLIADNNQHRIHSMSGHLMRDVTFGGGLLGKLKEGSSFSLAQAQVGQSLWQLTAIDVHLQGNALLFKSISLQQAEERSRFEPEPASITLERAADAIMSRPEVVLLQDKVAYKEN